MQKIIKPRNSSRQLLETVNFAFIKIFDSLVKKAIFGVFCLSSNRLASLVTARIELDAGVTQAVTRDANLFEERQNAPKMAFFTKQSIFCTKTKLILYPKIFFSLLCLLIARCILRHCPY